MNKIYVLYIGIQKIRSADIEEYINKINNILFPINVPENSTVLVLPTDSIENRLECIDPIYITDQDLIEKHNNLLSKLNKNINNIIKND
jgi:hypothetical protein